jgi:spermidine/putrescine transport system permease protein
MNARAQKWLVSGPPLVYLLFFFAIPTLIMVVASFRFPGDYDPLAPIFGTGDPDEVAGLTLESYQRFFADPIYLELFLKSFLYATATTLLCLLLAYPLALMIARSAKRYRDILVLLVILPFWSNFLIRVYAWMIILGEQSVFAKGFNGFLGLFGLDPMPLLFTPLAVLIGLVYVHLPFMVLPLYSALDRMDRSLMEASLDLGAGHLRTILLVVVPLAAPGIASGILITFIPALGAYLTPDLLGGTDSQMIANVIERQFKRANDWPFGAALSFLLMYLTFIASAVQALVQRKSERRG